jgi:hypothetical protein
MLDYQTKLKSVHACGEALEWLKKQNYPTLNDAWQVCERGDWMLWLAGKMSGEPMSDTRKPLVLAVCECVRLALPYVKPGETAPLAAIELAEKWARGDNSVTREMLRDAAYAAYAAYAVYVAYAAYDAANAANAAYVAYVAYVAYAVYAAYVVYAAYDDTNDTNDANDAANAKKETLKKCADIVRKYYPIAPEL